MAMQAARDVYTRRGEGVTIWVVPSGDDHRLRPGRGGRVVRAGREDKIYRHPTFYAIPDEVKNM